MCSALFRQSGSCPIFVWGPWQGQPARAVWRRRAWKLISVTLVHFLPSPSVFPWSGARSDNWRTVGRLLVVILVGTGFQRAPSALWVLAFVSAMPGAQLAPVPVNG